MILFRCTIPVCDFSQGNIKDYIIEGVNGYKFKDIDELPRLLSNTEDLYESCINHSKKFAIEMIAEQYISLFNQMKS